MFLNKKCKLMPRYFLISIVMSIVAFVPAAKNANRKPPAPASPLTHEPYGKLPMSFEENRGQFDGEFKFSARGPGYSLLLNAAGAVLKFQNEMSAPPATKTLVLKLLGADSNASVRGLDVLPGEANYFRGTKEYWITHIP